MKGYFSPIWKKRKGDDDIYSVKLLKPIKKETTHLVESRF